MDPEPGGPKTCGSGGSGFATLISGSGALHLNNELSREEEVVSHRRKSSPAIQRYPYMNYLCEIFFSVVSFQRE
jgi:hypothetical protein